MTSTPIIEKIDVVELSELAGTGHDAFFVAARGAGHTGWYGPVSSRVSNFVTTVLGPIVTGQPITDHRRLGGAMTRMLDTPITRPVSWAMGALDCAVWDLHGQITSSPVAELLAARVAASVPLYASWLDLDLSEPDAIDAVAQTGLDGWLFTKWGLRSQPADDPQSQAENFLRAVEMSKVALRGPAAFDAIFSWDKTLTNLFADRIDWADLLWLEDPLPDHELSSYPDLPSELPLAIGEGLILGSDTAALLELRPRALTLDVVGCGGLTYAVELVKLASTSGVSVYPQGQSLIPAIHLAAAFPETVIAVEFRLEWEPIRQGLYARSWLPRQGTIRTPIRPGLGATPRGL